MYQLTLTQEEQNAIDWIGYRYPHGSELKDVLIASDWDSEEGWGEEDITFTLTEPQAWAVGDLLRDSQLECLSADLVEKLVRFLDLIV